jgi:hypothetical protein
VEERSKTGLRYVRKRLYTNLNSIEFFVVRERKPQTIDRGVSVNC